MRFTEVFRSINWKGFAPALVVVLNTFIWYTLTYNTFSNAVNALSFPVPEKLALFSLYILGTVGSAIIGAIFLKCRETCLLLWMLMGAIVTAMLITISDSNMLVNASISFLLGVSLGIGFPSCLAYFAEATTVDVRGTCGGMTWGLFGIVIGIGTVFGAVFAVALDVSSTFLILACWRAFGLLVLYLIIKRIGKSKQNVGSYPLTSVFRRREVMLYVIPWVMVSLVNFIEAPIVEIVLGSLYTFLSFIEFSFIGLFALLGGVLADLVGRKRVIISGFIMLGIGYAVLSFSSDLPLFQYMYTVCDGIAWGMFSSVFLITLWGDLAQDRKKEKYYVIGGLPFLLSGFLSILVQPYIGSISATESFSLASFFLFSAVLPLIYAPETLPERRVIEIELKDYLEKAQKVRDKYS